MKKLKRLSRNWSSIVILLALTASVFGQAPAKRTVIHAGHLLDVKTGKVESNQAIVIQGDKIVSVGPVVSSSVLGGRHSH